MYNRNTVGIQCLSLKCRSQHCGWRWQPQIAQLPAGKSKAIPPLHGGLQLSKIIKKNNHIPYNTRCWKCNPPSATHFRHFLQEMRKQSISLLITCLLSILLTCGDLRFYPWRHLKNKVYATNPPHVRRNESKYQE